MIIGERNVEHLALNGNVSSGLGAGNELDNTITGKGSAWTAARPPGTKVPYTGYSRFASVGRDKSEPNSSDVLLGGVTVHPEGGMMKLFLFLCLLVPWSGLVLAEKPVPADEAIKRELVEIMKGVNFLPQLGEDNPICKTFYEDFKTQKHIEHLKPILKVDSYDDPALKPYRDKCPDFDFNRNLSASRATGWTEEDWEAMGTPTYGMSNFQLYRVDLDNNPKNGEELVFYHEGEKTIERSLPYGSSIIEEKEYINPAGRGYRTIDLKRCKGTIGGAGFNRLGSAQWTRNGIIRYKNKNGIFVLKSGKGDRPNFRSLDLYMYSERLKRMAPTCAYDAPRTYKSGGPDTIHTPVTE